MNLRNNALAALSLATLLLTGCGGGNGAGAEQPSAGTRMPDMPATRQGAPEHVAEGRVNSVDASGGTVNISHGPVATADWPAMTMSFKLSNPAAAAGLQPGQQVRFHFTIQGGMAATVTEIMPLE